MTEKSITTSGMRIVTTLDPSLQNTVQSSLWAQLPPKSKTTAVMPIVDPHTGNVTAMATSKQYGLTNDGGHTTLPVFTTASAGGGSTYKLFSLLAALKAGVPTNMPLSANADMTYDTSHAVATPSPRERRRGPELQPDGDPGYGDAEVGPTPIRRARGQPLSGL